MRQGGLNASRTCEIRPGHLVHNGLLRMLPRSDTGGELAYRIRMFAEQAFTGLGPLNFTLQIEFGVPWFVIDYP